VDRPAHMPLEPLESYGMMVNRQDNGGVAEDLAAGKRHDDRGHDAKVGYWHSRRR
jgi:hypothetical protein